MIVSGSSMEDVLATMATSYAHQQVQNDVAVSVLKQQMQQQEIAGAALVEMINDTPIDGTGQLVNISA